MDRQGPAAAATVKRGGVRDAAAQYQSQHHASITARSERAGPGSLETSELLSVLGIEADAETIARTGLRGILDTPAKTLPREDQLRAGAVLELARRYLEEKVRRGNPITSPSHTRRFLCARLQSRAYEVFACLFLDNRHRGLAFEELFRGTVDGAGMPPREVAKRALDLNAAALIPAHNHPSVRTRRALTLRPRDHHQAERRPRTH